MSSECLQSVIDEVVRTARGSVLAALMSRVSDIHLAEDALQDALLSALSDWAKNGVPANPKAWLIRVAGRKMIDQLRRKQNFQNKSALIADAISPESELCSPMAAASAFFYPDDGEIPDERLRLIFTCCHPALSMEARVALTLHTLGRLSTEEIAKAFFVSTSTMSQRLVRAKKKIKHSNIPYVIPSGKDLDSRLSGVLSVLYLIFNEGYFKHSGDTNICNQLSEEAIRLTRVLHKLMPNDSEYADVGGLLALMLLHHSRSPSRLTQQGEIIRLSEQDRNLWDDTMISEGTGILEHVCSHKKPSFYTLQACISALHCEASDHSSTDWKQICVLYVQLLKLRPDSVTITNAAVAFSYADSPEKALQLLDHYTNEKLMADYTPYYAARADILKRMHRPQEAIDYYQTAHELSSNQTERRFYQTQIDTLNL